MERTEHHLQDSFSDNDDSYIEIELDPLAEASTCFNYDEDNKISSLNFNESEEYELRISISSTIPLPNFQQGLECSQPETSTAHPSPSSLLISCTTSANSSGTFTDLPLSHPSLGQTDQPRVLNTYNNMDLHYTTSTRKQGSMKTRNGGMMKLLIKLRAIKLGTLLSSLVKLRGASCSQDKKPSRSKSKTSILQCYEKSMVINPWGSEEQRSCSTSSSTVKSGEARKSNHWDSDSNKRSDTSSSSVVEIDLGALRVRGIFSALGIAQKRSSKRKSCSKSCDT